MTSTSECRKDCDVNALLWWAIVEGILWCLSLTKYIAAIALRL